MQFCIVKLLTLKYNQAYTVEFVRVTENRLLFVEAKTSFANTNNPAEGNFVKFQSEIDQIYEKLMHSLNMYSSVKVGAADSNML